MYYIWCIQIKAYNKARKIIDTCTSEPWAEGDPPLCYSSGKEIPTLLSHNYPLVRVWGYTEGWKRWEGEELQEPVLGPAPRTCMSWLKQGSYRQSWHYFETPSGKIKERTGLLPSVSLASWNCHSKRYLEPGDWKNEQNKPAPEQFPNKHHHSRQTQRAQWHVPGHLSGVEEPSTLFKWNFSEF